MNRKKFQVAFIFILLIMLAFGNVNVVKAANNIPIKPVVTVDLDFDEVTHGFIRSYSWANVPANEGYTIRFNTTGTPISVTVSSYSETETYFLVYPVQPPTKMQRSSVTLELLDPSGIVISYAKDFCL